MKVFDRFHGEVVNLPDHVEAGRYRLLKDLAFNSEILKEGQVLLVDGELDCTRTKIKYDDINQSFLEKHRLLKPALATIAQSILDGQEQGLSPLIPATVGEIAELAELELALLQRIKHLHEINQRPRLSMKYQPEVSPLSRARKISPAAITHLAAHSEHWHRRTLSGIQPKNILAMFSEDEWTIYENRVYARLLEKLDRYLKERHEEVNQLVEQFENALKLGDAKDLYYQLRISLCEQWGSAISENDTKRLLDASGNSLQKIVALRKQVSTLRNGILYAQIPRNLNVPEQLRETNILLHDQHYRHLRVLWFIYQKILKSTENEPDSCLFRNVDLFENYIVYVGMLIRRVFKNLPAIQFDVYTGVLNFAGMTGLLIREMDEWKLTLGSETLIIVPAFGYDSGKNFSKKQSRAVVYLYSNCDEDEVGFECLGPIISPLEFYGLERVRLLVEKFLWSPLFKGYGKSISKIPSKEKEWLSSHGWKSLDNSLVRLQPLTTLEKAQLDEWMKSAEINYETKFSIYKRVDELTEFSSCRQCKKTTIFISRDKGFLAICKECNLEIGINTIEGQQIAQLSVSDVVEPSFNNYGGWCINMPI